MKKIIIAITVLISMSFFGCDNDAAVASHNLSKAADQFEIYRRVVFYNGITDQYILMVEGYCSITVDNTDHQLELTVKTGNGTYLKHYLGLSDNVSYFVEQLQPAQVSKNQYKVIFKPSTIIPDVNIK